jgi:hypothetical protein
MFWPQHDWVNLMGTLSSVEKPVVVEGGDGARESPEGRPSLSSSKPKPGELRLTAEKVLAADVRAEVEAAPSGAVALLSLGIWIGLWVVWAFLARGGLTYWLAGACLVRADGRKAARWQCAGRAFLFWLPVSVLLGGLVALDSWFWSLGNPQPGGLLAWLPWLSFLVWLASMLLLPGYAVLALRSPTRAPHDRLMGTYLVPR